MIRNKITVTIIAILLTNTTSMFLIPRPSHTHIFASGTLIFLTSQFVILELICDQKHQINSDNSNLIQHGIARGRPYLIASRIPPGLGHCWGGVGRVGVSRWVDWSLNRSLNRSLAWKATDRPIDRATERATSTPRVQI